MTKWTHGIEGIEETAVREWAQGLATLTPDQIKRGLIETACDDWPPSMGEFRKACLGRRGCGSGGDKAYCKTYGYNRSPDPGKRTALPRANKTPALVDAFDGHMGELRDALQAKNNTHPGNQAMDLLRPEPRDTETAVSGERGEEEAK